MIHPEDTSHYIGRGILASGGGGLSRHHHGLGLTGPQDVQIATTVIGTGGSILAGSLVAAGAIGGPVGLVIGGVAAVAALATQWLFAPDTQKIAATHIVDQVQPYLVQNLAAWQASQKTKSEQVMALSTFDQLWAKVVAACGDPSLGQAGKNCIQDRATDQKGYSWFKAYRDPIANDPMVVSDVTPVSQLQNIASPLITGASNLVSSVVGGTGSSGLLLLGLGIVGLVLIFDSKS